MTTTESLDVAEHLARIVDELILPAVLVWVGTVVRRYLKLPPKERDRERI